MEMFVKRGVFLHLLLREKCFQRTVGDTAAEGSALPGSHSFCKNKVPGGYDISEAGQTVLLFLEVSILPGNDRVA